MSKSQFFVVAFFNGLKLIRNTPVVANSKEEALEQAQELCADEYKQSTSSSVVDTKQIGRYITDWVSFNLRIAEKGLMIPKSI